MSEEQLIALFHKEKPSEYTLKSIRLEARTADGFYLSVLERKDM